MKSQVAKKFLYKTFRFEFWPWWGLFLPLVPMYFYSVLRTRKLLYFTAVNPSIEMGGFFGEKKNEISQLIPAEYKPAEILITSSDNIKKHLPLPFDFPVFVKPNVGERGFEVHEIESEKELMHYAQKGFDFLIQEKLTAKEEFGVLFHKNSHNGGEVSSLAQKEFMVVVGDGGSSIAELIWNHKRHFLYDGVIEDLCSIELDHVPKKGEEIVVHQIGNHCKGTRFINANEHIDEDINRRFRELVEQVEGLDYGRFDIKADSIESIARGDFKVFELNGISSEPGHIYGNRHVFLAYRDLYKHWGHILQLSRKNIKKGVKTTPLKDFVLQVKHHFFT